MIDVEFDDGEFRIELWKARVEEGVADLPVICVAVVGAGFTSPLSQEQITRLDSERRAHRTAFRRLAQRN